MADEVQFAGGGSGKVRSFGVGLLLAVVTVGIYFWFWYYFLNNELKDIGAARGDQKLAGSNPSMSLIAVSIGAWLVVPPFLSVYNFGHRIKHAQRAAGVPDDELIHTGLAYTCYIFGFLIIPGLYYYHYITKNQNRALLAAAQ